MQEIKTLIEVYRAGFWTCAVLAAVSAVAAVVMFFRLDIRGVYRMMSGKAERQTVERLQRQNALSGRLTDPLEYATSGGLTGETGPMAAATEPLRQPAPAAPPAAAPPRQAPPPAAVPAQGSAGISVRKKVILVHTQERIPRSVQG